MNYTPYQPQRARPPRTPRQKTVAAVVLSVAGVVAALIIIGVLGAALGRHPQAAGTGPAGAASTPAATHPAAAPALGRAGRDGDFAFIVRGMSCGAAAASAVSAGGAGETVPPGAVECIVTMTVTDAKGAAQTFFVDDQYAYDAAGRQFSADTMAAIYLQGSQEGSQVNPGITVTALVPFQIPRGDRITRLVLHDSAFSAGVTVKP